MYLMQSQLCTIKKNLILRLWICILLGHRLPRWCCRWHRWGILVRSLYWWNSGIHARKQQKRLLHPRLYKAVQHWVGLEYREDLPRVVQLRVRIIRVWGRHGQHWHSHCLWIWRDKKKIDQLSDWCPKRNSAALIWNCKEWKEKLIFDCDKERYFLLGIVLYR